MWLESPVDTSGARVIRWAGRMLEITEARTEPRGAQRLVPGKWHLSWGGGSPTTEGGPEPGSAGAGLEVGALRAGWALGWVTRLVAEPVFSGAHLELGVHGAGHL